MTEVLMKPTGGPEAGRPDQGERDHSGEMADSASCPNPPIGNWPLGRYIEQDLSVAAIVKEGYRRDVVERVAGLVDHNEYKRRQAAPGVRVSEKALGRDRRLPITNRWVGG